MAKKLKTQSLFDLTFVADPQLSPQGNLAAAVHTHIETPEAEEQGEPKPPHYRSRIHLYNLARDSARAFTEPTSSASMPRFSPDGEQLAFLSDRQGDKKQLYLMPLSGGEAEQLSDLKAGVSEFVWHPKGRYIAFISRGDAEDKRAERGEPRVIDRLFYKLNGVGFRPDTPAQIYLFDLKKRKAKQLSELASDPSGLAFSPDGKTIYFSAATDIEAADRWESNLWRLPSKGGKPEAIVTNIARAYAPSPSPDGTQLAFFAPAMPENFGSPTALWLVPNEGGEAQRLSEDEETQPGVNGDSRYGDYPNPACWSEDGKALLVNLNQGGKSQVTHYRLDEQRFLTPAESEWTHTSFHYASGKLLFTAEQPSHPGELFIRDRDGKERQLSEANRAFVKRYRLASSSHRQQISAQDGPAIDYWTLAPEKPRKDHALVLQVHGGPHTNYGYGFTFEFQLLASQGYTVVYGNPRGSSNYGSEFATCMQGGYGTIDADDVLAIARAARERHVEPGAPMHLTGGSYGGFMTNWLVTQTDEFASAVTQRSICNWLSFYGSSDIGYHFGDLEVAGNPWDNTQALWDQSPIKHVANVRTPLLIVHAEEDHRCPVEQAEQFYIALKKLGRAATTFIRFPGENHELSRAGRPDRRIARLEAIVDWFNRHG